MRHGLRKTKEYRSWYHAKGRCLNPTDDAYRLYGGRGIRMCHRWLNSPVAFVADVGLAPSKAHTIERVDNNGHYSCGRCVECLTHGWGMNCRWATRLEQARNQRRNKRLTWKGVSHTVGEWAEVTGVNYFTIQSRLDQGWSVHKTLSQAVREGNFNGCNPDPKNVDVLAQVSRHETVSASLLSVRLKRGWAIERALTTPARVGNYRR